MTPISLTMTNALQRATAAGALYRWPGGFWTDRPYTVHVQTATAARGVDAVPEWWVGSQTVTALIDRGLVSAMEWNIPRVAGRKLAIVTPIMVAPVK